MFKLVDALKAHIVTVMELKDKNYIIVLTTKEKNKIFSVIKNRVFLPAEEDTDGVFEFLSTMGSSAYFPCLDGVRPIVGTAPEHDLEVVKIVSPEKLEGYSNKIPDTLMEVLGKEGYSFELPKDKEIIFKDYSSYLDDPEARLLIENNAKQVSEKKAKYNDLPLELRLTAEGIMAGNYNGVILLGPTGTGKSFGVRVIADHFKAPLVSLQFSHGTIEDDLEGTYVPDTDADTDAKWKLAEGLLLKAYQKGYQILLDEVNLGMPGILAVLNQYADDSPTVTRQGKTYTRHPNFVIYMTMNPGYEGTEILNPALKNRFPKVSIDKLTKKAFVKRLANHTNKKIQDTFFEHLYEFMNTMEKEASGTRWHQNVCYSIRNAERLCNDLLLKKRSLEEFSSYIATQYLNDFSVDSDNAEKLIAFKNSTSVKEEIKILYELYSTADIAAAMEKIKIDRDFSSFFSDEKVTAETTESAEGVENPWEAVKYFEEE